MCHHHFSFVCLSYVASLIKQKHIMSKSVYGLLALLTYGWLHVGVHMDLSLYLMIKQQQFYYP